MSEKAELEEQIRRLNRRIEEMSARMSALEGRASAPDGAGRRQDRRSFLKLGAAAALGAVGVAATKVLPAAAANGATVATGATVTGENPTIIQGDAATAVPVFAAEAPGFSASNLAGAGTFAGALQGLGTTTGLVEGVDGWAQGPQAYAVYGLTDSGTGVVGESNTGIGLHARRSGRIRQDPLTAAGVPGYSPNDFEQVRDANGALWISGPGATWKQVTTTDMGMHLFPNPRRVWDGFVQPTAPGVYGPVDATTIVASQGGGPSGVPVGAQAAWCAVMSYELGVMTIFPDGTTEPIISNWSCGVTGPLSIFYMFVPLSAAAKFKFHTFYTGHKFFDVWGYLM